MKPGWWLIGSVHSVECGERSWSCMETWDRWCMAAICCQILISDQHTSHRLLPTLWYYDIFYWLGQPFQVHPHIQMKSQSTSADRSGETELTTIQSKAVPSLPARSPGTCLMIMTVRVRRLLLLQLGGQEGKNRKIPEVDTQLSRDSRSKLQLTVIAGHNDDVHCHLPPYSR